MTRVAAEETLEPNLTALVVNTAPHEDEPDDAPTLLAVEIRNVGGGIAKRPGMWVVARGRTLRAEYMGDGFLNPGEEIEILTPIVGPMEDGEAAVMVWCRDHREMLHVWTHLGQHKRYRPEWRREPWQVSKKYSDLWNEFFPGIEADDASELVARFQQRRYVRKPGD